MSPIRRPLSWFPRGVRLSDGEFDRRHGTLTALLLLQLPVLLAFGLYRGAALVPLLLELAFPLVAGVVGWSGSVRRRIRSFAVTAGLMYLSAALVHLSGGAAEASLHYLVMLSFIALYQDWAPFGWAVGFSGVSHLLLGWTGGTAGVAGTGIATGAPDLDVASLLGAVVVAGAGQLLVWKAAERQEAQTLAARSDAEEQEREAARRDAYAKMYVNLARRGQSLIERQVAVIDRLERDVEDPDLLGEVFELDHLTTRVRRHGESLLVVAGVDLPAFSAQPVALVEVVRGAQSEVEHYRRVAVRVDGAVSVAGPVVRDLRHLLAELLENATSFSAPTTSVEVVADTDADGRVVLRVVDHGIGFDDLRRDAINEALRDVEHLDEDSVRHLGLRVVGRLAAKHDVEVALTATPGGGTTASVVLPSTATSGVTAPTVAAAPPVAVAPPVQPTPSTDPGPAPGPTAPAAPAPVAEDVTATVDDDPEPLFAAAASAALAAAPARPDPVVHAAPPAAGPAQTDDADEEAPFEAPEPSATPVAPLSQGSFSARKGRSRSSRRRRGITARRPTPTPPAPTDVPAPAADELPTPVAAPLDGSFADHLVGVAPTTGADAAPPLPRRTPGAAPIIGAAASGHVPAAPIAGEEASPPPPLPRRDRGATTRAAEEEALDLFGQLDASSSRASLSSFQRAQRDAREGDQ